MAKGKTPPCRTGEFSAPRSLFRIAACRDRIRARRELPVIGKDLLALRPVDFSSPHSRRAAGIGEIKPQQRVRFRIDLAAMMDRLISVVRSYWVVHRFFQSRTRE